MTDPNASEASAAGGGDAAALPVSERAPAPTVAPRPLAAAPASAPSGLLWLVVVIAIALTAFVAAVGWRAWRDIRQQLDAAIVVQNELRGQLTDAGTRVDALKQQYEAQEARLATIESLPVRADPAAATDPTRSRDEAVLLDVDRLINLALTDLQVSSAVAPALAALQSADARLAQLARPRYLGLRRALARDIDKLRAVPSVDVVGFAIKLDQLSQALDGWNLLADPVSERTMEPLAEAPAPRDNWGRLRVWLGRELGDLVRIREAGPADVLLLTPVQSQLVRERLRLHLLMARQAMLSHNQKLFRLEIDEAVQMVNRYFDVQQSSVAASFAQLKTISAVTVGVDLPLDLDSAAALRAAIPR